ncbi:MAG: T9SS C-terminal target domain-containing protein [Candidatus Hydrogenedentota bacterium]|nr:MAG: T9SS C-terminal target domain-containing protein [Candidatus Hydrogenedentota bacterium]
MMLIFLFKMVKKRKRATPAFISTWCWPCALVSFLLGNLIFGVAPPARAAIEVFNITPTIVKAGSGAPIIISGQNFSSTTPVKIGDKPVSPVVYLNSHTLKVSVPTSLDSGVYSITVGSGADSATLVNPRLHVLSFAAEVAYIAGGNDTLAVVNLDDGSIITTVSMPGILGGSNQLPVGMAAAPDGNKIFIASFDGAFPRKIYVFSTVSNTIVDEISVSDPVRIRMFPGGETLAVISNDPPNNVHFFRLSDTTEVYSGGSVSWNGTDLAMHPSGKYFYAIYSSGSYISVIDARDGTTVDSISVTYSGVGPHFLTISPTGDSLYVSFSEQNAFAAVGLTDTGMIRGDTAVIPKATGVMNNAVMVMNLDGTKLFYGGNRVASYGVTNLKTGVASTITGTWNNTNGSARSSDGQYIWATNYSTETLNKIRISDDVEESTIDITSAGGIGGMGILTLPRVIPMNDSMIPYIQSVSLYVPVGGEVTINGFFDSASHYGFTSTDTVWIGGIPVETMTVLGQTLIKATLPSSIPADTVVDVLVKNVVSGMTSDSLGFQPQDTVTVTGPAPTITAIVPDSGYSGAVTPVTITGTNFDPVLTKAYIEGTELANVTYVSPTQLTAEIPNGQSPGVHNISVANYPVNEQWDTLWNAFTVNQTQMEISGALPRNPVLKGDSFWMWIYGSGFDTSMVPTVTLGGVALSRVKVPNTKVITAFYDGVTPLATGWNNVTVSYGAFPDSQAQLVNAVEVFDSGAQYIYLLPYLDASSDSLYVVDVAKNEVVDTIEVGNVGFDGALDISPDGEYLLVTASDGKTLKVVRLSDNTIVSTKTFSQVVTCGVFSQDGSAVYVGYAPVSASAAINKYSFPGFSLLKSYPTSGSVLDFVAISPLEDYAAYGRKWDPTMKLMDLSTGAETILAGTYVNGSDRDIYFSPDGSKLYVTSVNGGATTDSLVVVDVATNTVLYDTLLPVLTGGQNGAYSLVFHPSGDTYFVSSFGGFIAFDAATNRLLDSAALGSQSGGIDILPDGTRVYQGVSSWSGWDGWIYAPVTYPGGNVSLGTPVHTGIPGDIRVIPRGVKYVFRGLVPPHLTIASPDSGIENETQTITLYGSDFSPTPTVYFGGVVSSSVTYVSSTELTVVAPALTAGTYAIRIVNPDLGESTKDSAYTVYPAAAFVPDTAFGSFYKDPSLRDSVSLFVPGDTVYFQVGDTNPNTNAARQETLTVVIITAEGDSASLLLYEDGVSSETFTSETTPLFITDDAGIGVNGTDTYLYAVSGDTFFVIYSDPQDTSDTFFLVAMVLSGASVGVVSLDNGQYSLDSTVTATVIDTDQNKNAVLAETVTVRLVSEVGNDTEWLILTETGNNTNVFDNSGAPVALSDTTGADSGYDGILRVGGADTIHLFYADQSGNIETSAVTVPRQTASSVAFALSEYRIDSSVTVTVTDPDENLNPTVKDQVLVFLTELSTGDTETVTLTETMDTSGVFVSVAGVFLSDTYGADSGQDGVLLCGDADSIQVLYWDRNFSAAADTAVDTTSVFFNSGAGTVTFMAVNEELAIGSESIVIVVYDRDGNKNPRLQDSVYVEVTVDGTARDTEHLVLYETGDTTATFSDSVVGLVSPLKSQENETGTADNGIVEWLVGDILRVTYRDSDGVSPAVQDTVTGVSSASIGSFFGIKLVYELDSAVLIGLSDTDQNRNLSASETVEVVVFDESSNDTEIVVLTERGVDSWLFDNSGSLLKLSDTSGGVVENDGILLVGVGDTIHFRYQDQSGLIDTTTTTLSRQTLASVSFSVSEYRIDSRVVGITVSDADENLSPRRKDVVKVLLRSNLSGDTEYVLLEETTETSGVFVDTAGGVRLSDTTGRLSPWDGVILAGAPDSITVTYVDENNDALADSAVDSVTVLFYPGAASVIIDSSNGVIQTGAESLVIFVFDRDQNADPTVRDTVFVLVTLDTRYADTEYLILRETAETSGIFSDSIAGIVRALSTENNAVGTVNDGVLQTILFDTIVVIYSDSDGVSSAAFATIRTVEPIVASPSSISFGLSAYALDSSLTVILIDTDQNRTPFAVETSAVVLMDTETNDSLVLYLTEANANNSTFAGGAVDLSDTLSGSGRLLVGMLDQVIVQYDDGDAPGAGTDSSTAVMTILFTASNGALNLAADTVTPGGTGLLVTVEDRDRNMDPVSPDTLEVTLRTVIPAPDTEVLILTETTDTSGMFTGTQYVSDTTGAGVGDGILLGRVGETIWILYSDTREGQTDSAEATVLIEPVEESSRTAFDTAVYLQDSFATVFVTDADQDIDPFSPDTVLITLSNGVLGAETEIVVLTETTDSSGIFSGTAVISSNVLDSVAGNGRLFAGVGDSIVAFYTDPTRQSDTSVDTALVLAVPSVSTVILDDLGYAWDSAVTVTVVDTDQNRNRNLQETVTVIVSDTETNDSVVIVLTESGVNSSLFTSSALRLSDTAGGESTLLAGAGDLFSVEYEDRDFPGIGNDTSFGIATVLFIPSSGTLSLASDTVSPGATVVVTVADADENMDPLVRDTLEVILVTTVPGDDTEILELTETTETSGIFANGNGQWVSDTTGAGVGDGILLGRIGSQIRVVYSDTRNGQNDRSETTVTIEVVRSSAVLTFDLSKYTPDTPVRITVTDFDQNLNSFATETVFVILENLNVASETEIYELRETTESSGIFLGTASLSDTPTDSGVYGDGVLYAEPGHLIRAMYQDSVAASDTAAETAAVVSRVPPTASTIQLDSTDYRLTERFTITVTDPDENQKGWVVDQVTVRVVSNGPLADTETFTLTEQSPNAGIFVSNPIDLSDTNTTEGDGILGITVGATLTASYVDKDDATDSASVQATAVAVLTHSISEFVDQGGVARSSFIMGTDTIQIRVVDANQNKNSLAIETINLGPVFTSASGDANSVTLTESDSASGIFLSQEFSMDTGANADNAVVSVDTSLEQITFVYTDPDDPADTSMISAQVVFAIPPIAALKFEAVPGNGGTTVINIYPLTSAGDTSVSYDGAQVLATQKNFGTATGGLLDTGGFISNGKVAVGYDKIENARLYLAITIQGTLFNGVVNLSDRPNGKVDFVSQMETGGVFLVLNVDSRITSGVDSFSIVGNSGFNDSQLIYIQTGDTLLEQIPGRVLLRKVSGGEVLPEFSVLAIRDSGIQIHEFSDTPLVVRIYYPDADNDGYVDTTAGKVLEKSLLMYSMEESETGARRWTRVEGARVNAEENFVEATVYHLTLFTLVGGTATKSLSSFIVYPNPFRPKLGHKSVIFDNLPSGATVQIYTISGDLVDEKVVPAGSNRLQWDGRNAFGRLVVSGVYIYRISTTSESKVGKLFVIR